MLTLFLQPRRKRGSGQKSLTAKTANDNSDNIVRHGNLFQKKLKESRPMSLRKFSHSVMATLWPHGIYRLLKKNLI